MRGVQARFEFVDQALSTYRPDSALSRSMTSTVAPWVDIDPEFMIVLNAALDLAALSDGAYDPTVGPLVNLWGFGPDTERSRVPEAAAIEAARARVGWRKVELDVLQHRARKQPGVRLDLSLTRQGARRGPGGRIPRPVGAANYLIDLSGKLRAHGHNAGGEPWRVWRSSNPRPTIPPVGRGWVPVVVTLRDSSIATSGDYRRYFETGGHHYSHIIDPHSGWPVTHATLSSTARAPTA